MDKPGKVHSMLNTKKKSILEAEETKSLNLLANIFSTKKLKSDINICNTVSYIGGSKCDKNIKPIIANNYTDYSCDIHENNNEYSSSSSNGINNVIQVNEIDHNSLSASDTSDYQYYNDFDIDAYSKCSSHDDNIDIEENIDDNGDVNYSTVYLPFSKLSGFCISEIVDFQKSNEQISLITKDKSHDLLYDHHSCAMTRG